MNFSISCNYCARTIVVVESIGEREVNVLLAHLMNFHSSVVKTVTQLGDLLMSFKIVQESLH